MSVDVTEQAAVGGLERFRDLPQFSDFAVPLPVLSTGGSKDPRAQVARLGELFGTTSTPLSLALQITEGEQARRLFVDAGPDGARVTDKPAKKLDVEIILGADTWQELAAAKVSPLEAFVAGRMRFRGDLTTAQRVLRKLRRADGDNSEGN
jgi:putative sterol carrier protein